MKRELRKSMNVIDKELAKIRSMRNELTVCDLHEAKEVFKLSNSLACEIFFPEDSKNI